MPRNSLVLTFVLCPCAAARGGTAGGVFVAERVADAAGANERDHDPAQSCARSAHPPIKNVHNPSIEVHLPPAGKKPWARRFWLRPAAATAAGGDRKGRICSTGSTDRASRSLLKYRLAQTPGYKYTVEGEAPAGHAAGDSHHSRPRRNGASSRRGSACWAFGGRALAALADIRFDRGKADAADPIDRVSAVRISWASSIRAGRRWTSPRRPTPRRPSLTSAGSDDEFHARQTVEFFTSLFKVGVPADLHIYGARRPRGGGIRPRATDRPSAPGISVSTNGWRTSACSTRGRRARARASRGRSACSSTACARAVRQGRSRLDRSGARLRFRVRRTGRHYNLPPETFKAQRSRPGA